MDVSDEKEEAFKQLLEQLVKVKFTIPEDHSQLTLNHEELKEQLQICATYEEEGEEEGSEDSSSDYEVILLSLLEKLNDDVTYLNRIIDALDDDVEAFS